MRLQLSIIIAILALFVLGGTMIADVSAAAPSGYLFTKSHVIYGSNGDLDDYQVMFVIHNGSGTDSGMDVYLNYHSLSWPNDIRFNDENGNLLNYWIESSDSNTAIVWVKVPHIPASPGNTTVNLYYGKRNDVSLSNGSNTFLMFDNFDGTSLNSSLWTVPSSDGLVTVNRSTCSLGYLGTSGEEKIQSVKSWVEPVRLRSRLSSYHFGTTPSGGSAYEIFMLSSRDSQNEINCFYYADAAVNKNRYRCNDNGNFSYAQIQGWTANVFAVQEIDWVPGALATFKVNDACQQQITTNVPTSSTPLYAKFAASSWTNTASQITVDWVFAAKYAAVEPQHGNWSTESTVPQASTPFVGIEGLGAIGLGVLLFALRRKDQ